MPRIKRAWIIFFTLTSILSEKACQTAVVNGIYSTINFPYTLAYINTVRPIITGSLLDDHRNPVSNETVEIFINNISTGTTTSNDAGIYEFQIEQDLSDGQHMVTVLCVESHVTLGPHSFTIDTTIPSIIIEQPHEQETINSTTFTVSGTTQANSMIETFLDDDTYGLLCYADETGRWSIEYTAADGPHMLQARATNAAGSQGALSGVLSFTVTSLP